MLRRDNGASLCVCSVEAVQDFAHTQDNGASLCVCSVKVTKFPYRVKEEQANLSLCRFYAKSEINKHYWGHNILCTIY